jgi:hypothetical protein
MLIGFTLCFVGDLVGMISKNPQAMTFILVLPAVILVMVSVGLQPADQFPGWLQPFVRNQPTSQFLYALRACAGDAGHSTVAVTTSNIAHALAWLAGMLVVSGPLYALAIWRRRRSLLRMRMPSRVAWNYVTIQVPDWTANNNQRLHPNCSFGRAGYRRGVYSFGGDTTRRRSSRP